MASPETHDFFPLALARYRAQVARGSLLMFCWPQFVCPGHTQAQWKSRLGPPDRFCTGLAPPLMASYGMHSGTVRT